MLYEAAKRKLENGVVTKVRLNTPADLFCSLLIRLSVLIVAQPLKGGVWKNGNLSSHC